MTDSAQSRTAPADYQKTIRIKASPEFVFDAITTTPGLTAWWTSATGSGDAGGELRFKMDPPEPLVVHVDEATRPTSVQWTVTECPFLPDWVGTRPTFTITAVEGDSSELHFRHHGLSPVLDCFELCEPSWEHFIGKSLRDYVEIGTGHPRNSEADKAWRAETLAPAE